MGKRSLKRALGYLLAFVLASAPVLSSGMRRTEEAVTEGDMSMKIRGSLLRLCLCIRIKECQKTVRSA